MQKSKKYGSLVNVDRFAAFEEIFEREAMVFKQAWEDGDCVGGGCALFKVEAVNGRDLVHFTFDLVSAIEKEAGITQYDIKLCGDKILVYIYDRDGPIKLINLLYDYDPSKELNKLNEQWPE